MGEKIIEETNERSSVNAEEEGIMKQNAVEEGRSDLRFTSPALSRKWTPVGRKRIARATSQRTHWSRVKQQDKRIIMKLEQIAKIKRVSQAKKNKNRRYAEGGGGDGEVKEVGNRDNQPEQDQEEDVTNMRGGRGGGKHEGEQE
eukprot:742962-Hanusia_phi.AAC.5